MNRSFNLVLTILSFLLCFTSVHHADAKDIGWGIPKGENHEQPWPGQEFDDIIRQNDAYYIGSKDEMMIYLTFDCGYENGNTGIILDSLKKHGVSVPYKAIVTETNIGWIFHQLYEELAREHEAMSQ